MQSIFRLPWCTDTLAPEPKQDAAFHKPRPASLADIPLLEKLKRKRSDDAIDILPIERDFKRTKLFLPKSLLPHPGRRDAPRGSYVRHQPSVSAVSQPASKDVMSSIPAPAAPPARPDDGASLSSAPLVAATMTPLQQTIDHQFNLEILLKHRELRLIDQELAKCQIALEQLRRCEVIPYPGTDVSIDVSTGTGPALRAPVGHSQPAAPAPWGVTDGPYSRHLASWLLPDSTFDSSSPHTLPTAAPADLAARPSRSSLSLSIKPVKSRAGRESISTVAAAQSAAATPVRGRGGPLVLKRLSDNQFVKLVCTKCHRSDFSSVQGFLNHCRIAHKLDYKSHEAAAQDCGQPLEQHETALAATAPPPVGTVTKAAVPKPAPIPQSATTVHALAQPALPRLTWKRQRLAYIQSLASARPAATSSASVPISQESMVPSASQPHLSSLLAKRGQAMDLASVVARLCQPIDIEAEDADDEIDDSQSAIATPVNGRSFSGSPFGDRPSSKKGFNQAGSRPRPAPLAGPLSIASPPSREVPESPQDHELSPNTADSNPGLVSDHDDDDPPSDSEARSVLGAPTGGIQMHHHHGCGPGDSMDIDIEDDAEAHDSVIMRSHSPSRQDEPDIAGSPSRPRARYGRGGHG